MELGCVRRGAEARSGRIDEAWGTLTWLASGAIGNSEHLTVGRVRIRSGASNPRHYHDGCEEILHLLAGRLEHAVGGESVRLEPGDTLVVPRGVPHAARNVSDVDAEMVVVYDSGSRDFHPA
jgi:quercetin dioxygenase-like cupin family protein